MKDRATDIHPATARRWPDLEKLFGPNGAYSNCWCMWWRLRHRDFRVLQPARRKAGLRNWVRAGAEPRLLAYRKGIPVGWCAVAPRSEYAGLAASRNLKPVDSAAGVWSVTCYFVAREGYPVVAERLAGLRRLHGRRASVRARRVPRRGAAKPRFARHAEDSPADAAMRRLWNFSSPSESEQRFRAALAGARGDLRLELEAPVWTTTRDK